MHMLLLIGVSVGFALSVLTSNNFYSEKTFTSSVNQVMCNEMKSEHCQNLIAQASDLPLNGGYVGRNGSSGRKSSRDLVDIVERFFNRLFNPISSFFGRFF